jgi:dinuclear metal center YbgI/SA1388 family protein
MKVKDITQYLSNIAPLQYQESYDNAGLIVGDINMELTGVLICLDSTEAVLEEAIQKKCNMVVAHHPIVFKGLKSFTGANYVERVIIKAIKHNIALYASHTNLDNVQSNGVNQKIAEKIGLHNQQILAPKDDLLSKLAVFVPTASAAVVKNALFEAGAGAIGNYSECSFTTQGKGSFKANNQATPFVGTKEERHYEKEVKVEVVYLRHQQRRIVNALCAAHPYEEVAYDLLAMSNKYNRVGSGMIGDLESPQDPLAFLESLKDIFKLKILKHTALLGTPIKRVAVCGGSGSFLLNKAISAKADVFITADYKYHQYFDADNKLIIADIGHFESEQYTIELFYELLTQKFLNFAIYCTEINTNPINYI